MRRAATTICCSALALAALLPAPLAAQTAGPARLPLLPARPHWTLALNNALTAPPAFDGPRGYFPIEGDRLAAYDLAAGTRLWIAAAQPRFQPVVGDRFVFVAHNEALLALHADDGAEAWRVPLEAPLAVQPVWHDGWLIVADVAGTVAALAGRDGRSVWTCRAGSKSSAPPALLGDRVYVPLEDRRILALRLEDGAIVWERRLGGPATGVFAFDDRVYAGSIDNYLYCLTSSRGEVAWRWRTGADVIGTPVIEGDLLYFVSLDNILRALNRRGGSQRWKRPLPLRPRAGPLLAGGTLVVGGLSPTLRAFAAATGNPAGDLSLGGELAAPPYVFAAGGLPVLVAVTSDIAKGATVTGFIPATGLPVPFSGLPDPPIVPPLDLR